MSRFELNLITDALKSKLELEKAQRSLSEINDKIKKQIGTSLPKKIVIGDKMVIVTLSKGVVQIHVSGLDGVFP